MSFLAYSTLCARVRAFKTNVLAPDRRRNPWVRLACRLLGIALLAGVLGIGMVLYWGLVVFHAIYRMLHGKSPVLSPQEQRVVDAEYHRVVEQRKLEPQVVNKEF